MQPMQDLPLPMMTDEQFFESIMTLFDVDDELWRQRTWAEYRAEASRRKKTLEFDRIYNACKKQLEPSNRDIASRYGFPLMTDSRGRVMLTIDNFVSILDNDPRFAGIRFNLMSDTAYIDGRKWTDADDSWMRNEIEKDYKIHNTAKLDDAFRIILRRREYHPVRELIEGLTWDGKSRIYTLFSKYLKCEDTDYTREVSRLFFAGGIHRVYNPGCQFDNMVVLIGTTQGEGKTSFLRWLVMEDEFFGEVTSVEGQQSIEALEGKWLCVFDEMYAMMRAKEQEAIKAYVTRRFDHYRRPYAKYTSETPRQCFFAGTTNHLEFIGDKTGGRRFFPIVVRVEPYTLHSRQEELREDVRQCWAEAKYLYDNGKLAPVANPDLYAEIKAAQAAASEEDYRIADIERYLALRENGGLTCVKQLWKDALGMPEDRAISAKDSRDIGVIMQNMRGWERVGNQHIGGYGKPKAWKKVGIKDDPEPKKVTEEP